MMLDRRRWLRVAVLCTGLALLATACPATEPDVAEPDDVADPDDDAAAEPAEGGTLTVARSADVDNLDPHLATAFQSRQALELIYETLVEFDEDLNVTEGLAESWEYSEDGQTLTFELREGVTFHDGTELTSEDVVASIERVLDDESGAVAGANFQTIDTVDAPDERTVVLELSEPDHTLPAAFADANAAIVSAAAIAAGTIEDEPNGTGAFLLDDWRPGEVFRLVGNDDYWRDPPAVDAVEIRVVPDQSSIAAGLQAGSYHVGLLEDPAIVLTLPEDSFTIERPAALAYRALMMNQEREPFGVPEVRQAIACAIDRQEVVDSAALGEGRVTGPFTAPEWQFDPTDGLPCDPPDVETAQELLADAGYEEGFSASAIVNADGYATAVDEATTLQAQLAEIGVDLELEVLESGVYVSRWIEVDFDVAVALNGGRPDPHHMYTRYFHSEGDLNHVATHSSDELDELVEAGLAAEPDERPAIYEELSRTLLADSPWVWLYSGYEYRVTQPEVEGFIPYADGSLRSLREVSVGE